MSAKSRLRNLANLIAKKPNDPYIRGQYISVKKTYRKTVKQAKRSYEMETIRLLEQKVSDPKSFWSFLKNIGGSKSQTGDAGPSSDEWLDHFTKLNANDPSSTAGADERVANILESLEKRLSPDPLHQSGQLTSPFTAKEVGDGIAKFLKNGKAVATDLLSNELIRTTNDIITPFLVALFNKLLDLEIYPDEWSLGIILPLFKSGDAADVNCYRGITINSCLSKLFMLLLNNRLQSFCDQHNIIHFNQIGFRKDFRPADHVFTLKTMVDQAFQAKEPLYVCFVDFRKAYDSVWRDGLYHKLLSTGVDPKFIRLLRNIYKSSSLAVRMSGGRSSIFPSNIGLKQGCNLSPLLFNLFINDFLTEVSMPFSHSPFLLDVPVNSLMYADDLVLVSRTKEGLQNLLDILHVFTESWFLKVNRSKTKTMCFSRVKCDPLGQMKFGPDLIDSAKSYCYLGTTFTDNGSLSEAASILHDKAIKAMYGLLGKVNKHRSCDPKLLLELFDKTILPIAMYNSEVWGPRCFPVNASNNDFLNVSTRKNPVEDVQVKFCKRILGVSDRSSANWSVLSECGRLPTMATVISKMITYWFHLNTTASPLLRAALEANTRLASTGFKSWFSYLHRCMKFLNMEHILYTSDIVEAKSLSQKSKKVAARLASRNWEELLVKMSNECSKLDLYCRLKSSADISPHLLAPISPKQKSAITKLRIRAHNLPIVTGRYTDIPRPQRVCPLCCLDVGSESHYLTDCQFQHFLESRSEIFSCMETLHPGFLMLNEADKVVLILNCSDAQTLSKIGKFSVKLLEYFKELNSLH